MLDTSKMQTANQRYFVFDSLSAPTLTCEFGANSTKPWKADIDYIRFETDVPYQDWIAVLQIQGLNSVASMKYKQCGKRINGSVLPILFPDDQTKIKITEKLCGTNANDCDITFTILDKDLSPLTINRLVIYIRFTFE